MIVFVAVYDRGSIAVVGGARQYRRGAIDLFAQHHPRQGVRPGLDAETQSLVGEIEQVWRQPVGAANQEDQVPDAGVTQSAHSAREGA